MKLSGDAGQIYRQVINAIHRNLRPEARLQLKPSSSSTEIGAVREKIESAIDIKIPKEAKPLEVRLHYCDDRVLFAGEDLNNFGLCRVEVGEPGIRIGSRFFELGKDIAASVLPEVFVKTIYENANWLEKLAEELQRAGRRSVIPEVLSEVKKVSPLLERAKLASSIEEIVAEEAMRLNRRVEEKIAGFEVTIKGEKVLELISGRIPEIEELENFLAEEIIKSERRIEELTGVRATIFSRSYPVEVNPNAVETIKRELEEDTIIELYVACRPVAEKISAMLPEINEEVKIAYELEFLQAVKEFCRGFVFPEFSDCISFTNGRYLFIKDCQPVSYAIGNCELAQGKIAILTGANSGGKTTLLELITQIQIMAQMGLPVNAEKACVDLVDEIFLFKRKRSLQSAGAFESAIKAFTKALLGEGKKLILIDEFEAITEPGAAVRIIAEFLKIAHERGHYVVIVSHLGKELSEMLPFARVDGIEARGLDDKFNLIVDRQPKFGKLGRSTPELILERLYRKARGREKEVLERIFASFRD